MTNADQSFCPKCQPIRIIILHSVNTLNTMENSDLSGNVT